MKSGISVTRQRLTIPALSCHTHRIMVLKVIYVLFLQIIIATCALSTNISMLHDGGGGDKRQKKNMRGNACNAE